MPDTDEETKQLEFMENNKIKITVGEIILSATLESNSSADALVKLLKKGAVTIRMEDYANMEKVGELPHTLPQNNGYVNTVPGSLILYLGKYFVIYYGTNSYNLTQLGKIDGDISGAELKKILGSGDVEVTISLEDAPL